MVTGVNPVTIPRSEIRPLESTIVDQTYQIHIGLPPGYKQADMAYPVVYASPAFPDFYFIWPIITSMLVSEELPPVILVGTGYGLDEPRENVLRRLRDHMPTRDQVMDQDVVEWAGTEPVGIGEADNFLRFIHEELQPFVDDNYRTQPDDTTYAGCSSSGLFGLHVLFKRPETFRRYILGSPPIFRADRAILDTEADYAARHDALPARVFLAVGGLEQQDPFSAIRPDYHFVDNVKALAKTVAARDYSGLQLTTEVFADETHLSVTPAIYSRGLRVVFDQI
ncbi:MAG: alpha/beta hydrolase-fold protein [Candidatus Promineifilaceae bacterium]|nr:alpha/beta hydrolase-fold protein [Candidatus Promineifilaceae bacterium]